MIILALLAGLFYVVFKWFRDYMFIIGIILLVVAVVLLIIGLNQEDKKNSWTNWSIGLGICSVLMIAFGAYIKWFMPGAAALN